MWEEKLDSGIQRKEASFSFNMIRKGFRKKWHLVWVLKKVSIGNELVLRFQVEEIAEEQEEIFSELQKAKCGCK